MSKFHSVERILLHECKSKIRDEGKQPKKHNLPENKHLGESSMFQSFELQFCQQRLSKRSYTLRDLLFRQHPKELILKLFVKKISICIVKKIIFLRIKIQNVQ